jgi:hypothetical protein
MSWCFPTIIPSHYNAYVRASPFGIMAHRLESPMLPLGVARGQEGMRQSNRRFSSKSRPQIHSKSLGTR